MVELLTVEFPSPKRRLPGERNPTTPAPAKLNEQVLQNAICRAFENKLRKSMFGEEYIVAFEKMTPEEKWTLSAGKVVEDELFEFGKKCNFEQSVTTATADLWRSGKLRKALNSMAS